MNWTALPYQGGGRLRLLATYIRMFQIARLKTDSNDVSLVHARSFLMGLTAWLLSKLRGTPYVFDARGYWVDERAESGHRFRVRLLYRLAKWIEKKISCQAAAVVTLTDLHKQDLQAGLRLSNVTAIATCVDFDCFRPDVRPDTVPP